MTLEEPTQCIEPDLLHPISSVEVEETIRSLPKQKSPGVDNLPAEFLQALSDTGIHLMTLLINRIYTTGIYPDEFLWSVFLPLPKVNKATKCSDHRAISLIPHASKILLQISNRRITPIINQHLSDSQLGFRKGRGKRDGIFLLRTICERMIEKKTDILLCFIDYTKAFDRINHERLISMLKNCGIPTLISELYWGQKAVVRTTCGNTNTIDIKRGVRQGCILSPAFFKLYSEQLLEEALSDTEGVLVNGKKITNTRYADDTVLIAKSELKEMINKVCDSCSRFGMELNAKKTKVVQVSKTAVPHNMKIQADGQHLNKSLCTNT